MSMMTHSFPDLLEPGIRKFFSFEYLRQKPLHDSIFENVSSKKAVEHFLSMAGIGLMSTRAQLQPTPTEDLAEGYMVDIEAAAYAKGMGMAEELIEDDQYGLVGRFSQQLALSARETEAVAAAAVLNDGFTTNGWDGVPLFSASHPLVKGGTYSNLVTAADPSPLLVESFDQAAADLTDENGIPIEAEITKFVVPNQQKFTWGEILNSAGRPDSMNRGDNPVQGYAPFVSWKRLTDEDATFALVNIGKDPGLIGIKRKLPFVVKDSNPSTRGRYWYIHSRFVYSYVNQRAIIGCAGA